MYGSALAGARVLEDGLPNPQYALLPAPAPATARVSPNPWLFIAFTAIAVLALLAVIWIAMS